MVSTTHMCLVRTKKVASMTQKLNFSFYLILINFKKLIDLIK